MIRQKREEGIVMDDSTKARSPNQALNSAIGRLHDIAELLSDEGRDIEARSLVTTAADLEWQLEELGKVDGHVVSLSFAI
jgi:hypothetical protein